MYALIFFAKIPQKPTSIVPCNKKAKQKKELRKNLWGGGTQIKNGCDKTIG